jgi:hypothetical protein
VVVQSLFESDGTTVLISTNAGASIEIEAAANAAPPIDLADASLGLTITSENNVGLAAIATPGLTPLLSLSQIRPRNRWLAWLGLGGQEMRPLAIAPDAGFGAFTMRSPPATPDNAELRHEIAKELGKPVDELFQVVELE